MPVHLRSHPLLWRQVQSKTASEDVQGQHPCIRVAQLWGTIPTLQLSVDTLRSLWQLLRTHHPSYPTSPDSPSPRVALHAALWLPPCAYCSQDIWPVADTYVRRLRNSEENMCARKLGTNTHVYDKQRCALLTFLNSTKAIFVTYGFTEHAVFIYRRPYDLIVGA